MCAMLREDGELKSESRPWKARKQAIYSYQFNILYLRFGEVASVLICAWSFEGVGSIPVWDIFS